MASWSLAFLFFIFRKMIAFMLWLASLPGVDYSMSFFWWKVLNLLLVMLSIMTLQISTILVALVTEATGEPLSLLMEMGIHLRRVTMNPPNMLDHIMFVVEPFGT